MTLEDAAKYWNRKLTLGAPINRVRVRRLLALQGAERRGALIMDRIRSVLEGNGLYTEPDFQSVWSDTLVSIRLQASQSSSALQGSDTERAELDEEEDSTVPDIDPSVEQLPVDDLATEDKGEALNSPPGDTGLVEVAVQRDEDPLVRVSSIASAHKRLTTVLMDDPLEKATTLMMLTGYSQLAIMQNDREAKGLISWESIAKRSLQATPPKSVGDCRIDAPVVDIDASLYDALPTIASYGLRTGESAQPKAYRYRDRKRPVSRIRKKRVCVHMYTHYRNLNSWSLTPQSLSHRLGNTGTSFQGTNRM